MTRYVPLVAFLVSIGCASTVDVEQEQNALLETDRAWSQSVTDMDKFVAYFAPDATFYPAGMPAVTGAEAIRKTFGEISAAPGFSLSWTAGEAVVAAGGDIGYTTGKYTLSIAGGSEEGKYVTVWKKDGDAWKVTEDIFNADSAPQAASAHVMMAPGDLTWTDPPPSLPPGSRLAIISGDPAQAQPFVIRAQVPAGYRVAPHWHPGDENLTILSGTVALGMGEQFDESTMTAIGPGGYASLPADMRHYFLAKSAATFQVHGMGPFVVNYVNPADDPSKPK